MIKPVTWKAYRKVNANGKLTQVRVKMRLTHNASLFSYAMYGPMRVMRGRNLLYQFESEAEDTLVLTLGYGWVLNMNADVKDKRLIKRVNTALRALCRALQDNKEQIVSDRLRDWVVDHWPEALALIVKHNQVLGRKLNRQKAEIEEQIDVQRRELDRAILTFTNLLREST